MGLFAGGNSSSENVDVTVSQTELSAGRAAAQDQATSVAGNDNVVIVENLAPAVVGDALGFAGDAVIAGFAVQQDAGRNVLDAQSNALGFAGDVVGDALGFAGDAADRAAYAQSDALGFAGDAADRAAYAQSDALGFAGDAADRAAYAQSSALAAVVDSGARSSALIADLSKSLKSGDSGLMLKAVYAVGGVLAVVMLGVFLR